MVATSKPKSQHEQLCRIVEAWPTLPPAIRRAMLAMVEAVDDDAIAATDDPPMLNETERLVYDILANLDPHDAMSSSEIAAELEPRGKSIGPDTLRSRYLGRNARLRSWGLESTPRGYRVPVSRRQLEAATG